MRVIHCLCLQTLEEQISQEDSTSQALREEVLAKERNILEFRSAMKEVQKASFPPRVLPIYYLTVVDVNSGYCVLAVSPEPGTNGAEPHPAGANERCRSAEQQPGLFFHAAGRGSPHAEAARRNCLMPQWLAFSVQHSDPKSSGKRPQSVPTIWPHM